MNRPPELKFGLPENPTGAPMPYGSELARCKIVSDSSWKAFLYWLVAELPALARSFADLDLIRTECKYRVLVRAFALECYSLNRALDAEKGTTTALLSGLPGGLIEDVRPDDFHLLGQAKDPAGAVYRFGVLKPIGNIPAIASAKTGKVVAFEWKELVLLAAQKGVDDDGRRIILPR